MPQGRGSHPCCQLVNGHFFQQGTPEPPGLCSAPLGSPVPVESAQSNAAGGIGDLEAAREGTRGMCSLLPKEFVHSRAIASLPVSLGRTPFFQKTVNLTVDMTVTLHRHTRSSPEHKLKSLRSPGSLEGGKCTRLPLLLLDYVSEKGNGIKCIQKMKYYKDSWMSTDVQEWAGSHPTIRVIWEKQIKLSLVSADQQQH